MPVIDLDYRFHRLRSVLLAGLIIACLTGVASAQNPTYLNLPVPQSSVSNTYGVNSSGQVVGSYWISGEGHQLFVWKDGVTTLIGTPYQFGIFFAAINNRGQVAFTVNPQFNSFLWDNGTITPIGKFAVSAINDNGIISGCQQNLLQAGSRQSVIWNGGDLDFLRPQGGNTPFTCALDLNNSNKVVGTFYDFQGVPVSGGYEWEQGTTTILGTLGGPYTIAVGINDAGQVTGSTTAGNGIVQAFLWQNGVIQGIGFPAGESFSSGVRIDAAGRIAGNSRFPWVWKNGVFTALNGGSCGGEQNCVVPIMAGIADRGTGGIAAGNCVNPTSPFKYAACIWTVP